MCDFLSFHKKKAIKPLVSASHGSDVLPKCRSLSYLDDDHAFDIFVWSGLFMWIRSTGKLIYLSTEAIPHIKDVNIDICRYTHFMSHAQVYWVSHFYSLILEFSETILEWLCECNILPSGIWVFPGCKMARWHSVSMPTGTKQCHCARPASSDVTSL